MQLGKKIAGNSSTSEKNCQAFWPCKCMVSVHLMKSVYQHIRSKSSTGGLHDLLELLVEDAMKSFKLASLAELGYTFD